MKTTAVVHDHVNRTITVDQVPDDLQAGDTLQFASPMGRLRGMLEIKRDAFWIGFGIGLIVALSTAFLILLIVSSL